MKTSIIIPSFDRTQILLKRIVNLMDTTEKQDVEIVVVTENCNSISALQGMADRGWIHLITAGERNAVEAWNLGAEFSVGDYIILGSDDVSWKKDWLSTTLKEIGNNGFIGLYDGRYAPDLLAQHFMATREWYKKYNGATLAIPCYRSWFLDTETTARAKRSDTFLQTSIQVIDHQIDMPDMDDLTYQRGARWHEEDKRIYEIRKLLDFPDDFHGVIK